MGRKKTALSSSSECSAMRPSLMCVFHFSFVVASSVARSPQLNRRRVVAVSDNVAQLTCVTELMLHDNAFAEVPAGVMAMVHLTQLIVRRRRGLFRVGN